jgi:hypothetical protein
MGAAASTAAATAKTLKDRRYLLLLLRENLKCDAPCATVL